MLKIIVEVRFFGAQDEIKQRFVLQGLTTTLFLKVKNVLRLTGNPPYMKRVIRDNTEMALDVLNTPFF